MEISKLNALAKDVNDSIIVLDVELSDFWDYFEEKYGNEDMETFCKIRSLVDMTRDVGSKAASVYVEVSKMDELLKALENYKEANENGTV